MGHPPIKQTGTRGVAHARESFYHPGEEGVNAGNPHPVYLSAFRGPRKLERRAMRLTTVDGEIGAAYTPLVVTTSARADAEMSSFHRGAARPGSARAGRRRCASRTATTSRASTTTSPPRWTNTPYHLLRPPETRRAFGAGEGGARRSRDARVPTRLRCRLATGTTSVTTSSSRWRTSARMIAPPRRRISCAAEGCLTPTSSRPPRSDTGALTPARVGPTICGQAVRARARRAAGSMPHARAPALRIARTEVTIRPP